VRREEGSPVPDIVWLRPDGTPMQPEDWDAGFGRAVGVFLNGGGIRERDRRGSEIVDAHFLVYFNAGDEAVDFTVPEVEYSPSWDVLVDTAGHLANTGVVDPGDVVGVGAASLLVLIEHRAAPPEVDHSVAASLAQAVTAAIDEVPGAAPKSELPR
jgi:glycogen operon protein